MDVDKVLDAPGPLKDRFQEVETVIHRAVSISKRSAPAPQRDGREVKFSNIAMCVVLGFPMSHIGNICHYFDSFVTQRDLTIASITGKIDGVDRYDVFYEHCSKGTLWALDPEFGTKEKESRAANILMRIIIQSHHHADKRYDGGEMSRGGRGRGRGGRHDNYRLSKAHLRRDNVRNLLMKEAGNTLYTLMTCISRLQPDAFDKYKPAVKDAPKANLPTLSPDEFPALPGSALVPVGLENLPQIAKTLPNTLGLPEPNDKLQGVWDKRGATVYKPTDNEDEDFTL
jgi:hypothetical protein